MGDDPGKKKIFLIDDEAFFHGIATSLLSDRYNVLAAKSGKEALVLLLKSKPDLILLDIMMPEMDGWETFHKIRGISLLQDVPIAFITSLSEAEAFEEAKRLGAVDFFTKPLVAKDFLKRIDKILK